MDHEKSQKVTQSRLIELLIGLTVDQRRFITARMECSTDTAAAEKIGIRRETVSRWQNRAQIDEAMGLIQLEPIEGALAVIQQSVVKAAMVKVAGLESKSESIRQGAATEVLDRNLGRPNQPLSGKDGEPLLGSLSDTEFVGRLAALIATIGARGIAGDGAGLALPLEPDSST